MQPQELFQRIRSKQAPAIIDVRSGLEFQTGHIPGAVHAPAWKILTQQAKIPSDRSSELVITCEHGPRAQLAKGLLKLLGYHKVSLLEGHMAAWRQAGRPMEK